MSCVRRIVTLRFSCYQKYAIIAGKRIKQAAKLIGDGKDIIVTGPTPLPVKIKKMDSPKRTLQEQKISRIMAAQSLQGTRTNRKHSPKSPQIPFVDLYNE